MTHDVTHAWKGARGVTPGVGVLLLIGWTGASPASPDDVADSLVRLRGPGGISVMIGDPDPAAACSLRARSDALVHCLYREPAALANARATIRERGVYGEVSADRWDGRALPYVDNLLNALVAEPADALVADGLTAREVARVMAPLGVVLLGRGGDELRRGLEPLGFDIGTVGTRVTAVRRWPGDIDMWGHFCHGPDGNPVGADLRVGPPAHYQWISGPLYLRAHDTDSSLNALVSSNGRLFYVVDEAPISLPGQHELPDDWRLAARDAFNGRLLWKIPLPDWGWRAWKTSWFQARPGDFPLNIQRRVVADGDTVYATLGYKAPVSRIDARTGNVQHVYAGTERTNEILCRGDALVVSALREEGVRILRVDARNGKTVWATPPRFKGTVKDYIKFSEGRNPGIDPVKLDPAVNLASDGRVVCLLDGRDLVCLDYASGRERWRTEVADEPDGTWLGSLILSGDVVVCATAKTLTAFSRDAGKPLWSRPKRPLGHLWYEWKDVFVIDGLVWTYGDGILRQGGEHKSSWPAAVVGYDVRTGAVKKTVPLGHIYTAHHHHRCYRNKATPRYILTSRRGTEFVDLREGRHTVHNWVRGTCHMGMMPANGLQYAPPHPCRCYQNEKLDGFNALAAARAEPAPPGKGGRLETGSAFRRSAGADAGPDDWPTYRHDAMRSGSTQAPLDAVLTPIWTADLGLRPGAPTAAAGRIFVPVPDGHRIVALDAPSGKTLWSFDAGGRVDSPPTSWKGSLLFGSSDGWVYCLRASDGALAWRFRAAPEDRRMGAFDQLESVWPVPGSVVVVEGVAYCAAGRSTYLDGGIHLYGLDVETGTPKAEGLLEAPRPDFSRTDTHFTYGGGPGTRNDILRADGAMVYLRDKAFGRDLRPRPKAPRPALQVQGGYLDDAYFQRASWSFGAFGDSYGRIIVHDDTTFWTVRMFDDMRLLTSTNYFVPGDKGYLLFAMGHAGKKEAWSTRVPIRATALVKAGNVLALAGPPDAADLAAFAGKRGGLLWIFDASTGTRRAEHALSSPPVFNGVAVSGGRLILTTTGGHVLCFAGGR